MIESNFTVDDIEFLWKKRLDNQLRSIVFKKWSNLWMARSYYRYSLLRVTFLSWKTNDGHKNILEEEKLKYVKSECNRDHTCFVKSQNQELDKLNSLSEQSLNNISHDTDNVFSSVSKTFKSTDIKKHADHSIVSVQSNMNTQSSKQSLLKSPTLMTHRARVSKTQTNSRVQMLSKANNIPKNNTQTPMTSIKSHLKHLRKSLLISFSSETEKTAINYHTAKYFRRWTQMITIKLCLNILADDHNIRYHLLRGFVALRQYTNRFVAMANRKFHISKDFNMQMLIKRTLLMLHSRRLLSQNVVYFHRSRCFTSSSGSSGGNNGSNNSGSSGNTDARCSHNNDSISTDFNVNTCTLPIRWQQLSCPLLHNNDTALHLLESINLLGKKSKKVSDTHYLLPLLCLTFYTLYDNGVNIPRKVNQFIKISKLSSGIISWKNKSVRDTVRRKLDARVVAARHKLSLKKALREILLYTSRRKATRSTKSALLSTRLRESHRAIARSLQQWSGRHRRTKHENRLIAVGALYRQKIALSTRFRQWLSVHRKDHKRRKLYSSCADLHYELKLKKSGLSCLLANCIYMQVDVGCVSRGQKYWDILCKKAGLETWRNWCHRVNKDTVYVQPRHRKQQPHRRQKQHPFKHTILLSEYKVRKHFHMWYTHVHTRVYEKGGPTRRRIGSSSQGFGKASNDCSVSQRPLLPSVDNSYHWAAAHSIITKDVVRRDVVSSDVVRKDVVSSALSMKRVLSTLSRRVVTRYVDGEMDQLGQSSRRRLLLKKGLLALVVYTWPFLETLNGLDDVQHFVAAEVTNSRGSSSSIANAALNDNSCFTSSNSKALKASSSSSSRNRDTLHYFW